MFDRIWELIFRSWRYATFAKIYLTSKKYHIWHKISCYVLVIKICNIYHVLQHSCETHNSVWTNSLKLFFSSFENGKITLHSYFYMYFNLITKYSWHLRGIWKVNGNLWLFKDSLSELIKRQACEYFWYRGKFFFLLGRDTEHTGRLKGFPSTDPC